MTTSSRSSPAWRGLSSLGQPDEKTLSWESRGWVGLCAGWHKEGRNVNPQVLIAMAVTRDGMPVRSWVLAGQHRRHGNGRAHQAGSARLAARPLPVPRRRRHVFGRQPPRTQPRPRPPRAGGADASCQGRGGRGADLAPAAIARSPTTWRSRKSWVGDGERRKRYVLWFNPAEAERQRQHRVEVLTELAVELNLLDERDEDHPRAACALMGSRRLGAHPQPGLAGLAEARRRQDEGGGEVRRQVGGDHQ